MLVNGLIPTQDISKLNKYVAIVSRAFAVKITVIFILVKLGCCLVAGTDKSIKFVGCYCQT